VRWRSTQGTRLIAGVVLLLAAAFAFKTLATLDLTSLWNDELRSVEKSFQPSPVFLLGYLRADVHPPLYYGLLWLCGQLFGQTVLVLRGLSWVSYVLGVMVLSRAVWDWRQSRVGACCAALLAAAMPFTVRFAVEGKGYSLMFALVALALWQRQRLERAEAGAALLYPVAFAAAALTHYYAMGLLLAQTLCDGIRRDRRLVGLDGLALLLPSLWMWSTSRFLLGTGGRDWIPAASPELLQKLVVLALGIHWPLVLALGAGLVLVLAAANRHRSSPSLRSLVRVWGLDAAALLAVGSVVISIWRPSAVDRYYIVLVPACIGFCSCWLGVQIQRGDLLRWRGLLLMGVLSVLLLVWWSDSFAQIAPTADRPYRKGQDFRAVSLRAALVELPEPPLKLSRQCRQLNASDHVLAQAGFLPAAAGRWRCPAKDQPLADWLSRVEGRTTTMRLVWAAIGRPKGRDQDPIEADRRELVASGLACSEPERLAPSTLMVRCHR